EDEPSDAIEATFCRLTLKAVGATRKPRSKDRASKAQRARTTRELVKAIHKGRIEEFAQATEMQVIDALKKIRKPMELRPLIDQALNQGTCVTTTSLLTGLGLKTEENFPDPEYKELAKALYTRSGECGL